MDQLESSTRNKGKKIKENYDKKSHPLRAVSAGRPVRIQDQVSCDKWDKCSIIIGIGNHRYYHVKLPSGRIYWRNRRFIREDTTGDPERANESSSLRIRLPKSHRDLTARPVRR